MPQSQSPSSQSLPSESDLSQELLPETASGTESDGNVSRETSQGTQAPVVYNVEATDYTAQLSEITTLLQSIDTTMREYVDMFYTEDGYRDKIIPDMYSTMVEFAEVLGYEYPDLTQAVENEYASRIIPGNAQYGRTYYENNNPLPQEFTYSTLLALVFAAFMGGFMLTSLSRVCAFGVRCIKKLFAKI